MHSRVPENSLMSPISARQVHTYTHTHTHIHAHAHALNIFVPEGGVTVKQISGVCLFNALTSTSELPDVSNLGKTGTHIHTHTHTHTHTYTRV